MLLVEDTAIKNKKTRRGFHLPGLFSHVTRVMLKNYLIPTTGIYCLLSI